MNKTARENGIEMILTRNVKDYKVKVITICTPTEYLSIYKGYKE